MIILRSTHSLERYINVYKIAQTKTLNFPKTDIQPVPYWIICFSFGILYGEICLQHEHEHIHFNICNFVNSNMKFPGSNLETTKKLAYRGLVVESTSLKHQLNNSWNIKVNIYFVKYTPKLLFFNYNPFVHIVDVHRNWKSLQLCIWRKCIRFGNLLEKKMKNRLSWVLEARGKYLRNSRISIKKTRPSAFTSLSLINRITMK